MLNCIISLVKGGLSPRIENEKFGKTLERKQPSQKTRFRRICLLLSSTDNNTMMSHRKLREYKVWLIENYKPKTVNLRLRALNCYPNPLGKRNCCCLF